MHYCVLSLSNSPLSRRILPYSSIRGSSGYQAHLCRQTAASSPAVRHLSTGSSVGAQRLDNRRWNAGCPAIVGHRRNRGELNRS